MNFWGILEINPTDEISVIKKAYAKKLKIYHPEDNPQGFQKLREAYDRALQYAENFKLHKTIDTENTGLITEKNIPENIFSNPITVDLFDDFIDENPKHEQAVHAFMQKVEALYHDFFSRIQEENWKELLNDEGMWDLNHRQFLNREMLVFLMDHHHFPKNIWQLFNRNFNWIELENDLYDGYPETFIDYLFKQISQDRGLRYSYFKENQQIDYEEYLNYRENAFMALLEKNYKSAEHYISLAYEIFPKDPELLCMKGEYYLGIKKKRKAAAVFRDAIRINPDDMEVYFYQAEILYNYNKTFQAIKLCKYILSRRSNDLEVSMLLAKLYFKLRWWHKAKKLFLSNLKINSSNMEAKNYLRHIADKFELKLKIQPLNLKLRSELKKIYVELGETEKINNLKITPMGVLKRLYHLFKIIMYTFIILIGIYIAFKSFFILAYLIIRLIGELYKQLRK
ncbi:hypothetical protein TEPIDINF_002636 [Tepidibacillus infernus]|uniref:hypothetical protein n=1 Tax=Tepidibacillus infernus TaxID=1806172 RepID=UPI003B69C779